jgi:DNA helicase-4
VSSTFHGSKGLEADVVVLLGLVDAKVNPRSFPARVPEDDLVCLPLSAQEDFPDAEERRLMYVALTRARHKVVIPVPVRGISEFVWELLQHSTQVVVYQRGDRVNLCPICTKGFFVRRGSRGFECSNGDCLMGMGDHGPSCPKCKTGFLHLKTSQSGFFVGCNRYPECTYIEKELSRKVASLRPPVVPNHERVVRRSGPLFAGGELEGIQGTATK